MAWMASRGSPNISPLTKEGTCHAHQGKGQQLAAGKGIDRKVGLHEVKILPCGWSAE